MNEILDKGFIEGNVTHIFLIFSSSILLRRFDKLRLKEHEFILAAPKLQILAHQISKISSKFDLHSSGHGAN